MQQTVTWLLEYPEGDFTPFEQIARYAPLHEIIELAFETLIDHDGDQYWNYVYHVAGERDVQMCSSVFLAHLDNALHEVKKSLRYILDDDGLLDFTDEYQIHTAILDKPTSSLLLHFHLVE